VYTYTLTELLSNSAGDSGTLEIITNGSTITWTGGMPISAYFVNLTLP
jgi:hypothetical protein